MGMRSLRKLAIGTATAVGLLGIGQPANAGSIFLTGHDVLLHSNQNGFSNVILNWLRGAGTSSEIAAANYRIGLVRGNAGFASTTVLNGSFGTFTQRDMTSFTGAADFATFLAGIDVLVIPSHTSCGGCDFETSDSTILNSFSAQIADYFNAGGDIWGNSGATLATYYDFLPPGAVASGLPISGSSGFVATAAGAAIGILPDMINGFQTHNRFTGFDPDFTVFETRGTEPEIISIGIRDATIVDGGIGGGGTTVPEPTTLALFGVGLAGLAIARRRRKRI